MKNILEQNTKENTKECMGCCKDFIRLKRFFYGFFFFFHVKNAMIHLLEMFQNIKIIEDQ